MIPLFERYPLITQRLPRLELGEFPTPAEKLSGLCCRLGSDNLYIKRDDISGHIYGGNKVRKLEFLLADARRYGAVKIITSGGAGSNHALATALYAKQAGMQAVLMLFRQANSHAVRENLLMNLYNGAELSHHDTYQEQLQAFEEVVRLLKVADDKAPYIIPLGGSSPIGAIGYVNAGFELAEQISAGELPLPSRIYLALGTMGTTVGLLLGLKAAGIKLCLHAVRVVNAFIADMNKCHTLFCQTNDLIRKLDPSFPLFSMEAEDLTIHHEYFGEKYGLYTPEAIAAATLLRDSDEIILDGTYTGKAFAAFVADARKESNEPILFWNTKNSRLFAPEALAVDYRRLPVSFHQYFTEPVQALDKEPF